jgi:peptidoglycan/xylan/chitin deacetylase (PgdA/CDA1 family)
MMALTPACGDNLDDDLAYNWDDRRVLCSDAIDDMDGTIHWHVIDRQLQEAHDGHWVALLHAHTPRETVSLHALEHVLDRADELGLRYYTYRDLEPGANPEPGLALAFDDSTPDQWFQIHDLLAQHEARVTFFVSRWREMTPVGHQEMAMLAFEGHDLEPHTMNHMHGKDYVAQHGMDAYLHDEVLPSFQALTDAGYPAPAAFAYPFGEHTREMDDAVLQYVGKVRVSPGSCPWHDR